MPAKLATHRYPSSGVLVVLGAFDYDSNNSSSNTSTSWMNSTHTQSTNNATQLWQPIGLGDICLGVFLGACTLLTVLGNSLVIFAVIRERYLRSITNYFIVSLAVADLLMGSVVMPFAVVTEVSHNYWPYGQNWCDLWHAFDVLSSTASILNLCAIAVERFWATENPISYPTKMTQGRCLLMVTAVWVCSAGISFPAIIWWRAVTPSVDPGQAVCLFTDDRSYLVISSTISFYVPLSVMIVVYLRIYRTASKLIRSLNAGTKVIYKNGKSGEMMVLRIHRGGTGPTINKPSPKSIDNNNQSGSPTAATTDSSYLENGCDHHASGYQAVGSQSPSEDSGGTNQCIARRIRRFALGKRLTKFSREQKAAKTLGIVMGIFIICWLPFFICNIILAVDNRLVTSPIVFSLVTWLGYINSSVNPIIYAHSMRDFRRAFIRLLCSCYLRGRYPGGNSSFMFEERSNVTRSVGTSNASLRITGTGSYTKSPPTKKTAGGPPPVVQPLVVTSDTCAAAPLSSSGGVPSVRQKELDTVHSLLLLRQTSV